MTRRYRELVGVQATFSKVVRRYSVALVYRWTEKGSMAQFGTMRTFDMERYDPMKSIARCQRRAYAAAVKKVWRRETTGVWEEYLQLKTGPEPHEFQDLAGWVVWGEW